MEREPFKGSFYNNTVPCRDTVIGRVAVIKVYHAVCVPRHCFFLSSWPFFLRCNDEVCLGAFGKNIL